MNQVQLWNIAAGHAIQTYPVQGKFVEQVVWSPDGIHIAFPTGDEIQVWNTRTGRQHLLLKELRSIAWSPDGKYVAGTIGYTVKVCDVATGKPVFTYRGHRDSVNSIVWSLDSKRIASASDDGTVQVWNATTGTYVFTYRGPGTAVEKVEWSPDGIYIASMSNGRQGSNYSSYNDRQRTIQVWVGV